MNLTQLILPLLLITITQNTFAQSDARSDAQKKDWLIDGSRYKAEVKLDESKKELVLTNGLLRRTFRIAPNCATIGFENLATGESIIRGVKPEARVTIDGVRYDVGGLTGQPNYAFLKEEWIDALKNDPRSFQYRGHEIGTPQKRFDWKQVRHHSNSTSWPPKGVTLRMDYAMPGAEKDDNNSVTISVHYELYDGIPAYSKWLTVENHTNKKIVVDRFTTEILAVVEHSSHVEFPGILQPTPNIHAETDYAFGGFTPLGSTRYSVHWLADPQYSSQVNYRRKTPCLLEIKPTVGPAQDVEAGKRFESFRAFVLPYDSYDRERKGLSLRRMYRTIAPWITENPLMMHVRWSDAKSVNKAIDQCAEVGFEMVILTFGSGFNIENESPDYIAQMKKYADYAKSKGIEIGGYSLLSSRRIGGGNDVVSPPGEKPAFGNAPALTSQWGQDYFRKLYEFYPKTGMALLEHDGSYPGDRDITARLPLQKGADDSRWVQWRIITDFYKWCRGNGIYLNVPDYYYLSGSNKCGMGYREVNWSLPRAQQVIHTRQNIYDGTWQKTPSMGWMFVPLTQYQGGGAAATIEPLDEHLAHYRAMMTSNLALGVQACYRGPRIYDTDRTRAMVKQTVGWFKTYREILESDMIHGRRADGRGVDWMLHVNPQLKHKGLLVAFNPAKAPVKKTISVNLYYTGLGRTANIRREDGKAKAYQISRDYRVNLELDIPAEDFSWYVIE